MYGNQHCFICRPSDSIVSEDAEIETSSCQFVFIQKDSVARFIKGGILLVFSF